MRTTVPLKIYPAAYDAHRTARMAAVQMNVRRRRLIRRSSVLSLIGHLRTFATPGWVACPRFCEGMRCEDMATPSRGHATQVDKHSHCWTSQQWHTARAGIAALVITTPC